MEDRLGLALTETAGVVLWPGFPGRGSSMDWFYWIFVVLAVAMLVWIIVWSYQHGGPKGAGRARSEFEQARDFPFDRRGSSDGGIDF